MSRQGIWAGHHLSRTSSADLVKHLAIEPSDNIKIAECSDLQATSPGCH
jgi:hypothetical protein